MSMRRISGGLVKSRTRSVFYSKKVVSMVLTSALVAGTSAALVGGTTSTAFGASSLIKPGAATCVYKQNTLSAIRIEPPQARSWSRKHKTFANWQAVLERRDNGTWRRLEVSDFDGNYVPLKGTTFRRLNRRQQFAAKIQEQPADAYLRIRVEVKWVNWSEDLLGRRSTLTTNYVGSPTRGCLRVKEGGDPGPEVGSPVWWGNAARTSLNSGSTRLETKKGLVPLTGDFDGDAHSDILWYDPAGPEEIWWGFGRTFDPEPANNQMGGGMMPVVGDFDGDGRDDVYWYVAGEGNDLQWWGSTDRVLEPSTTSDAHGVWDILAVGDFDGDGFDDIYFYVKTDKTISCDEKEHQVVWWGHSGRSTPLSTGAIGVYAAACYFLPFGVDVDGNSTDELVLYGLPPNGRDAIYWGKPGRPPFGGGSSRFDGALVSGFRPVAGDFDGDSRDDIFWFSANGDDAQWWGIPPGTDTSTYGSGSVPYKTALQLNGDFYPVSGDFDGDGKDDILWYEK